MVQIWFPQVIEKIEAVEEYYLEHSAAWERNFRKRLDETVKRILEHPDWGMLTQTRPGVLSWRVEPHWRIYWEYDESEGAIYFIEFFDQRQDPAKLRF